MKRLHCFILGSFLLTVRAEKEDFQGYFTEQTKGRTVTKDLLLKKEIAIGHGTEAIPTEKTHQHTTILVTAKFLGAVSFDTRPAQPYKERQITKAIIDLPSTKHFTPRKRKKFLTLQRDPSAMRIDTDSEIPLISNYEKIALSSVQAAVESMMNDTSEPEVNLSADAEKAPPWLHTLLDYRNQRNTNSVKLTPADGSLGVPILSASYSREIDNLAALHNDNGDKQLQGTASANPRRNVYHAGTMQSIFQSVTAEDSLRGNPLTNLYLTYLKDRRPVSTEKSALSPHGSPDSLGTEGLALDYNELTTLLTNLYKQSAQEPEEFLNKYISHPRLTKHSSFSESGNLLNNQTLLSLSFSKTVNHSQSILNDSHNFFPSVTEAAAFHTGPLAEMSSDIKKQLRHTYPIEASVTEGPLSISTALHHSSKSLYIVRKPVKNEEKLSAVDPQSILIYLSKNNKTASHGLSTNFKSYIQNHSLDISSESVSNIPAIAEAPQSSDTSDHSTASHSTVRVSSTEAHNSTTPFSESRPTTLAIKNPETHFLTGRVDSLISVLRHQTPAKPNLRTKEPILSLVPMDSAIKLASVTTKRHLTDRQDPLTFSAVHSIGKQSFVDPPGPMNKPFTKELQSTTTTTREVFPGKLFLSELRQGFGDDMSMLTLTTPSSKLFSEKLTISRFSGTRSEIPQGRIFDVINDRNVAPTSQSYSTFSIIRESLRDYNKMKAVIKLQEGEKMKYSTSEYRREKFKESRKQEKIINTAAKTDQNTDKERGEMAKHMAKTSKEDGERTIGEEDVTLRQGNKPRQGKVSDEKGPERDSVTKIYKEDSTKVLSEKQREHLTEEGAEVRSEETLSKADIKCIGDTGEEDMTNASPGPTTNLKEFNRDKGHTVANLSSCHSLIKQLGATEHKSIHLNENTTQIVEIMNKSFTYKVTSNQRPTSLRYQNPNQSKTAPLLREPYTQIKSHLLAPRIVLPKHEVTLSLSKKSAWNKDIQATFSVTAISKPSCTFGDCTLNFRGILKPSISPHSSAAKLAQPSLNSISKVLLLTHRLPTTVRFLRAQPHFTVNSSTPNISIIYNIPDHRYKFSTSVSKGNSILHTINDTEQTEYIIPSVNPTPHQKMYNDSSTRPPTATALSSETHISIGWLQPCQVQAAPQISQSSSSFDMTSGQPCSFKLSEQTAHPDALHTPVDDNKQRSVHNLMASQSPKAKNDQFSPTNMSPLLNLSLFGGDILPGTYRLTGLTRSVSEKNLLRANSITQYASSERDYAKSLLGTADDPNQNKENDSMLTMVTPKVKHLEPPAKQISAERNEKNSFNFILQVNGRTEDYNIDEFNSLSLTQTEKLAVKNINSNELVNVNENDGATNTGTIPIKSIMYEVPSRPRTEQATDDDFMHIMNDVGIPVFDTNTKTGTSPVVESDILLEIPKIQTNDVTNNSIFDLKHHGANMTEKQNNSSTLQGTVSDGALPMQHIDFRSDMLDLSKFTQRTDDRIVNVTSPFHIITTVTNDSVSPAPTPTIGGVTVSKEDYESLLMATESVPIVEKSSHTSVEHMEQSNSHTELLPLKGPPITSTTSKFTPAVKRQHTSETPSAEQPEHNTSVEATERSQHAPSAMFAITHNINDEEKDIKTGLLKTSHRAEGPNVLTSTMFRKTEYSPIKDIKTALTTESTFEAKHLLLEKISTAYTQDRREQHDRQTLHEKTSISQLISGSMTDQPTLILPTEIINKTSCRTIGCVKSVRIIKTTTGAGKFDHGQKMYKTQGAVTERDNFSAEDTLDTKSENGNCSSDCPVPGKATPQATDREYAVLSPVISKSDHNHASVDETVSKKFRGMTNKTFHFERHWTPEQPQSVMKTTQRNVHRETSEALEAPVKEVTLSEREVAALRTTIKATERTLLSEKDTKTQLKRGAGKAEIFEAQDATRSVRAVAEEESGRRLLKPESESELPKLKHRRRTSPHLYFPGITEVSEDLCGSGNYTAEMSLDLGRGVEPGDAVPARGNLRVVINLKTNNSQLNLEVTSCCLSPTIQPDLANATCCLFSRLAAEPAGITLLPTALSTSASFTISLFQMINYSVVYLHCDLSVCLRNHSECERQCLQQRNALPLAGPQTVTNLRNRISFGPMLKQVKNSTFSEEIDPSELDLVLVIVSLVVGFSLVTVMLLLVWLAYRKRGSWLPHSATPPRACCGCLHPGGDLILP